MLYKFLGKKGAFYLLDLEPISIKLNYRCKEGTVEEGSFSCGKTPEEAKKNYEKQQKEKQGNINSIQKSESTKSTFITDVKSLKTKENELLNKYIAKKTENEGQGFGPIEYYIDCIKTTIELLKIKRV